MKIESRRAWKIGAAALVATLAATSLAGCAKETTATTGDQTITIYSGRSEDLIAPLLEQFTAETGIGVEVRYSDSASLAAQILEEGTNVQADVFFSQDAGALGAVSEAGAFKTLNSDITDLVDAKYRAADNSWVGVSGRSRVISYDPTKITEAELGEIERRACPGEGACGGMFTANTMASVAEAIGMSLPGSAAPPAVWPHPPD